MRSYEECQFGTLHRSEKSLDNSKHDTGTFLARFLSLKRNSESKCSSEFDDSPGVFTKSSLFSSPFYCNFSRRSRRLCLSDTHTVLVHPAGLNNAPTVRPDGIADRENYFRTNYACHSRYSYRQKLFRNYFFVADAGTAVLCSLKGAARSTQQLFRN